MFIVLPRKYGNSIICENEIKHKKMYSVWFGCKTCRRSFLNLDDLFEHIEVHPLCVDRGIRQKDQTISFISSPTLFEQENILSSADDDQQQHLNVKPVVDNVQESKGEEPTSTDTVQSKKRNRRRFLSTPYVLRKRRLTTSQESPMQSEIQINNGFNKSPNSLLQCRFCLKPQLSKQSLILHERIHTGLKLHSNNKEFESKSKSAKSVMMKFTCSYCYKGFSDKSSVLVHERLHTGEKPYSCERCGSKFRAISERSFHLFKSRSSACSKRYRHIRPSDSVKNKKTTTTTTTKEIQEIDESDITQGFKCNHRNCEKSFRTKAQLRNHSISLHFDIYPFKCPELNCKKKFQTDDLLSDHLDTHSDSLWLIRPTGLSFHFHCQHPNCEKVFRQKLGFQRHYSSRHTQDCSGSGSKAEADSFEYKKCSGSNCITSRYQSGGDRRPIECPHPNCTKIFKFESTLRIYSETHSKLKPYKCTVPKCKKRFKSPYKVKAHVQTHTRDRNRV